jgi:Concanavalin A-like lectin/glucanases superfamily
MESLVMKNILIGLIVCILLFCGILIYVLYANMYVDQTQQKISYIDQTRDGYVLTSSPLVIPGIPSPSFNGTTYSFEFWLYVNEVQTGNTTLFSFGNAPASTIVSPSAPDPIKGSITFTLGETNGQQSVTMSMPCSNPSTCSAPESLTIPYIPMKRWVYVASTIDLGTNTVKAYVDGDLVQTIHVTNKSAFPSANYLVIGGNVSSPQIMIAGLGYVQTIMDDPYIYSEYMKGPIPSKYGLPNNYGIRSPIVKLDE